MKTYLKFISLCCGFALLMSCNSYSSMSMASPQSERGTTIHVPDNSLALVDYLRRVPGLSIYGEGRNASVRIRGSASFVSDTEPLFVVNGQPLTGGLRAAVETLPINEIRTVKVLKNPSDVGMYGVRGSNGVIEITMR